MKEDTAPPPSVAPLLLFPGEVTEPLSLTALLREAHEGAAADRLAEIERRTKFRTPLDDSTDWAALAGFGATLVDSIAKHRSTAVRETCAAIVDRVSPALAPLGDFVPPAAELSIVFRTVSPQDAGGIATRRVHAHRRWLAAQAADDVDATIAANLLYRGAIDLLVRAAVVEVHGARIRGADGDKITDLSAAVLDGLDRAGLLTSIHEACLHVQGLAPGKVALSGSSPQST